MHIEVESVVIKVKNKAFSTIVSEFGNAITVFSTSIMALSA